MNKAVIPLVVFLGLAGVFLYMLGKMNDGEYNPRDIPSEFVGKAAPDFSLPDLYNPEKLVGPANYKGQVFLINVWGTWCPECWREHDYLMSLNQRGVTILGINWRDEANEAKAMLARAGNPFHAIAFDPDSNAVIDYGVYGAPETFLVDADGIIRVKHKGGMNEQVWQEKFLPHFGGNS